MWGYSSDLDGLNGIKVWVQSSNNVCIACHQAGVFTRIYPVKYDPSIADYTITGAYAGYINLNAGEFGTRTNFVYDTLDSMVCSAEGLPTITNIPVNWPNASTHSVWETTHTYNAGAIVPAAANATGITLSDVAAAATGTFTSSGGLAYNSGWNLNPGAKYYVQADGTLGNVGSGTPVGYAVTKNHMYLYVN